MIGWLMERLLHISLAFDFGGEKRCLLSFMTALGVREGRTAEGMGGIVDGSIHSLAHTAPFNLLLLLPCET